VLVAIARIRPELVWAADTGSDGASLQFLAAGLIVSFGLALFVAPFACDWPDGLEKVAATLGFEHAAAEQPVVASPMPDYALPGIGSPVVATALAGVVGVVVVFGLSWLLARALAPRTEK
jgi:hypothetical protein